jgi:hypothetical protein
MGPSAFWRAWLLSVCVLTALFGLVMIFLIQSPLLGGLSGQIDGVFWPGGSLPPGAAAFQSWVYGAWGASVTGLGLLAGMVGVHGFNTRQTWARNSLALAVGAWFVLDTAVSATSEVWANVALNVIILILFSPPLLATWRDFPPLGGG